MNDRTKRRLLKIAALAERGVGGEKTNAESLLKKSLKRHGLTMADIEKEQQEKIIKAYYPNTVAERKLLDHIVAQVANTFGVDMYTHKNKRKYRGFKLTAIEHIEAEAMFSYYKKLLKSETEIFLEAFVNKHHIFPESSEEKENEDCDFRKLEKITNLMRAMEPGKFVPANRQIESRKVIDINL